MEHIMERIKPPSELDIDSVIVRVSIVLKRTVVVNKD